MGLTNSSTGFGAVRERVKKGDGYTAALAGNPNVGKSSIFNALTGMKQHTGNWTGKTVATAVGVSQRENITFVDLPGTYSIRAHSPEEEVAKDFIKNGDADAVIVVCDALCIEGGLSLAFQISEFCENLIICVNFMDEAEKRGISVDTALLTKLTGFTSVGVSARSGLGLSELCKTVKNPSLKEKNSRQPIYPEFVENELDALRENGYSRGDVIESWLSDSGDDAVVEALSRCHAEYDGDFSEMLLTRPIIAAEGIACDVVKCENGNSELCTYRAGYTRRDRMIDRVITHRFLSVPIMLLMLAGIFWLTIVGSNYPSALLQSGFDRLERFLYDAASPLPEMLRELLVCGMLRTLFRVISVMLPPMAIFFPLFTLMEDFGLLGRIAFNLDGALSRSGACGKQALTMCMGLGCNAAGVVGCRIIDSPRERMIAILTNNFMPCNGRFPILITVSALLCAGGGGTWGAVIMTAAILLGVLATLAVSKILSLTLLRGTPSSFTLELPPYRRPQIGKVIVRSVFDRTLFVLGRAAAVAAPAGLIIWLLANVTVGDITLLSHICGALDPLGRILGLDGVILCAFILGFPANEIVLPLAVMCYTASGSIGGDVGTLDVLISNGWTSLTFVNMIIMTLFHFPCSTTVLTVKKETGSVFMAFLSMIIPTIIGIVLCAITAAVARLFW